MEATVKPYPMGGLEIELETGPEAFAPTSTSQMLAKVVDIPRDSTVLDLGCGVGNLAIFAALKGARQVYAVDVMPEACALARRNAERNGVADRVDVRCGDLFAPLNSLAFDVIIDDVSGIADEVARLSGWFPEPVPTGGPDGTQHVTAMLQSVSKRLHPGGVLYLPISSLSNVSKILHAARSAFGSKIEQLSQVNFPFCPELRQHFDRLCTLKEQGIIDFTTRGSRAVWSLQIYRAWV